MKNKILTFFCLLFFSLNAYAQRTDGTALSPILEQAMPLIQKLEQNNYEIVRLEFDILKNEKETHRKLFTEWEYGIIAFGEPDRVNDIDLEIYQQSGEDWVMVAKDTKEKGAAASINFTPNNDGTYKIKIKGYDFAENGSHYGLIIYHE